MDKHFSQGLFDLTDQVAVVTGGAGVICATLCQALAESGIKVAILDIDYPAADKLAAEICQAGGDALAVECDVCVKASIASAAKKVIDQYSRLDVLINGAGGNSAQATTSPQLAFFDLPEDAIQQVIDLNWISTIYACQVFGKLMAEKEKGVILNIASMNAIRPLTRIPAYSAAKAAICNFTQWLAVYMAQEFSPEIRVNAIAPGFFLTNQNRFLLTQETSGALTERGQKIIEHTPMKRFGNPDDLVGSVLWLLSPAAAFVTGIVVPVDGGFSAYSGV